MAGQIFHHNAICATKWYLRCGMGQNLCHHGPGSVPGVWAQRWVGDSTTLMCYQMVFSSAMLWNLQHYSLVVCDRMLVTACKTIPAMFQMFNQDGGQWFHHNAICPFKWYLNCGMCQTLCHMVLKVSHTSMCTGSVSSVQAKQWVEDSATMLFKQWNGLEPPLL